MSSTSKIVSNFQLVCVSKAKQASKQVSIGGGWKKEIVNHGLLCFRIQMFCCFLEQGESEYPNFGTQKQTNIPILGFATIFFSCCFCMVPLRHPA
jgi:hypothetical protein